MKVVIDISEEIYNIYKDVKKLYEISFADRAIYEGIIAVAIKNGTPLPKGHGRLIDADALVDSLSSSDRDIYCKAVIEEEASTILDADREKEKEFEEER